jgi:hypothetical protein
MCSKQTFRYLRMLVTAFALGLGGASCALYEGPAPARNKDIPELGCMKDFGARFVDYFEGRATEDDVNRLANCSVRALQAFQKVARGKNNDRFTSQEIRNFLQQYFLEDIVLSDGLLRELMRVKQAFLGGEIEDFTPEDLVFAEKLIITFRDVFVRLHSSMPISLDRLKREDASYVDRVVSAVADASAILGRQITQVDASYKFEDLARLFDEVARAFPRRARVIEPVRERLNMAGCLKEILISPYRSREDVTSTEWKMILEDGARWFGVFAKLLNANAHYPSLTMGEGRERLGLLLNETLDLLERTTVRHCPPRLALPNGKCRIEPGIPIAAIHEIIDLSEWDGKLLGVQFQRSTLKSLVTPVIQRLLGDTDLGPTGRQATRLTRAHLERVRKSIREWMIGARYVDALYARLVTPNFDATTEASTDSIVAPPACDVLAIPCDDEQEPVAIAEGLRAVFGRTVDLAGPDGTRVLYDGKNASRGRSYQELASYAWLRPFLKRIVLGYIEDSPDSERAVGVQGLNRKEFGMLVDHYWPLFLDLKVVGPKNLREEDASKRFREASLFTQVSDGNNLLSVDEGVQLVLLMFSADPMSRDAHVRVAEVCPTEGLDDFGRPKVEPHCYRKSFFDLRRENRKYVDLWGGMPLLVDFYEGLGEKERAEFARSIETISRKSGKVEIESYFTSVDTQVATMIYHFIEGIFQRYDQDKNSRIDEKEADQAFVIFQRTLAEIAKKDPDNANVKAIFFWLLAKGEPPIPNTKPWWKRYWDVPEFIWWSWTSPSFEADRLSLLKVFAALASASSLPRTDAKAEGSSALRVQPKKSHRTPVR